MNRIRAILAAVLVLTTFPSQAREVVTIGVLAFRGAERSLAEWTATRDALQAALPGRDFQLIPLDLAGTRRAVASGDVDFLITNPGNYVELEAAFGISRIATMEGGDNVASVIFTRAGRDDVDGLKDLRGTSVMAVGREAFGGFQIAWRELADHGVDPFSDLRLRFSGFPMDQIVDRVLDGTVDAGIVRACLLEGMAKDGAIRLSELKILNPRPGPCMRSSRTYPDWPFAKLARTPPVLSKRVATALLGMTPPPGEPGWTVPLDYQPVHELMRSLHIGPYADLRRPSLAELFWRYWHWLLMAAIAAVWWIVHVLRVEHLVRQRTAELEQALAERQRAEERERLQRQEIEHVARLSILGEISGNLAHELNQPLAAIVNYADGCALRLESGAAGKDELVAATRRISEQAARAGQVIQRIRSFVRRRDTVRAPFDLNDAVREMVEFFDIQARRRGVRVSFQAGDLPVVEGDRIQVQQVLLNLLQNAAEAMEDTPAAERLVQVSTLRHGSGAAVWVEDRGSGFGAEARAHLFEPYFTTKAEGIGLGLALSRSIIEAHGGRLWAEENVGRGVTMKLALPAAAEEGR